MGGTPSPRTFIAVLATNTLRETPTTARAKGRSRRGDAVAETTHRTRLTPGTPASGLGSHLPDIVTYLATTLPTLWRRAYGRGPSTIAFITITIGPYIAVDYMAAPPAYVIIAADTA